MPVTVDQKAVEQPTHLQNLNSRLDKQNDELDILLFKLQSIGHRISDTNHPQEEGIKTNYPDLPFSDGELKSYHLHLDRNQRLINYLRETVDKIGELV